MWYYIFFQHEWESLPLWIQSTKSISTRAILACFTAFILGCIIGPYIIKSLKKGQVIDDNEKCDSAAVREQNKSKKNTPIMGGLIIIVALLFSIIFWAQLDIPYIFGAIVSVICFGMLGFVDDYIKSSSKSKGLRARTKMLGILIISGSLAFFLWWQWHETPEQLRLIMPGIKDMYWSLSWAGGSGLILWIVLVMAGSSNAVNLTDGMDGLAIGCAIAVAVAIALLAGLAQNSTLAETWLLPHTQGAGELAICAMALVGAGLAFLWFNSYPATIFMGDCGSLMLGGFLSYLALVLKIELLYFVLGGIFVLETVSVIIQVTVYKIRHTRVFLCAPLHHHFSLGAWKSETKVTMRFWILQAMLLFLVFGFLLCH